MKTMTDDELRLAIEANEADCFSTLRALGSHVEAQSLEEATRLTTGIPFWLFNGLFKVRISSASALNQVDSWLAHYKAKQLPFGVFLFPQSTTPELTQALTARGFKCGSENTMVVFDSEDLESFQLPPLAQDYQLVEIRSAEQYELFAPCFAQVFALPETLLSVLNAWARSYGFDESLSMQNIAILHKGIAVAVASFHLHAGVAGIFNVGVHPNYRLKGLGLQVTRAIAELARKRGVRYLVGSGSPEGMNVYRKAKIRELGKCHRWSIELSE